MIGRAVASRRAAPRGVGGAAPRRGPLRVAAVLALAAFGTLDGARWLAAGLAPGVPLPIARAQDRPEPPARVPTLILRRAPAPEPEAPAAAPPVEAAAPGSPSERPAAAPSVAAAAPAPSPERPAAAVAATAPLAQDPPAQLAAVAPPPAASTPKPDLGAEVEAATGRAALLGLLAAGADPAQVAARLAALGYVATPVAATEQWLRPGEGETFRDCPDCPELELVPAGEVTMRIEAGPDSARDVTVAIANPFAVGRIEVTRKEFADFVAATGHAATGGCYARAPAWQLDPALDWRAPGYAQGDDHPAACVSWDDAKAYLAFLSERTGHAYRLPTDPEWHFLAAAAAPQDDPARLCASGNGADETALEAYPDWFGAPCRDGHAHTAPAGAFAASPWGVHDLDGNLWEWVETCAPGSADEPFPPPTCAPGAPRILRGGSFADRPSLRRLDSRLVSPPAVRDQVVGFRVARDLRP